MKNSKFQKFQISDGRLESGILGIWKIKKPISTNGIGFFLLLMYARRGKVRL
jgi:hypothetical protein